MQKLIIKNFGPIKDVELDVNDFMVFIGPQASGKSTISKTLYFSEFLSCQIIIPIAHIYLLNIRMVFQLS